MEGHQRLAEPTTYGNYIDVLLCDFFIEFSTGCYSLPWVVVLGVA